MGYNWQSTLGDSAAISGVFAGFCFAFIVFVLGWSVANTYLVGGVTWGEVSVFLNGVAATLFITSSEFFISAKQFDIWSISDTLDKRFDEKFKEEGKSWKELREEVWLKCRVYERRGRLIYNIAIFVLFLATGFIIGSNNLPTALLVSGLGMILELYQILKKA
jgi:hypothetical protein